MNLKKWFLNLFKLQSKQSEFTVKRRHVKDVKPGEYIQIEWKRIVNGIGHLKCISNDPKTKKILLEVRWRNYIETNLEQYEKIILNYNSKELKNFHLLNHKIVSFPSKEADNESDIFSLQKQMNEALEKEEYEKADELQKKIDKILKSK